MFPTLGSSHLPYYFHSDGKYMMVYGCICVVGSIVTLDAVDLSRQVKTSVAKWETPQDNGGPHSSGSAVDIAYEYA
jgi:hypothetical protein